MTSEELFNKVDKFLEAGTLYKIEFAVPIGHSKKDEMLFKYLGKVGEGTLFQFENNFGRWKVTLSALQLNNRIKLPKEVKSKK